MTDPLPWPSRTDRLIYDELDSTMAEAARIAPDLSRPTWIMARRQTEGRGRRGRRWLAPEGHFAATYVYRPRATAPEAALRSFFAANAVFEALALKVDRDRLALKWPNDVLLDGGKVAGILLESVGTPAGLDWLAIGIGVNLVKAPSPIRDAAFPPVGLEEQGGDPVAPEEFLSYLASNIETEERLFDEMGFAPIRENWLRRAARLGEVITARTAREEFTGRFETVDEAGQLVLETPKGQVRIPAADVYF
ncbi:MAG: biotin--[acetyl-CoA-carboxylase] ligase [Silicimonas sp.]|jgi:BirA family biotin operon repressor/biotin-[acetyl-CoA-carboxylase] ligase|nr:biotin--[acetyl-CoA-carboxylase] ligase [Silicimonas sp.]